MRRWRDGRKWEILLLHTIFIGSLGEVAEIFSSRGASIKGLVFKVTALSVPVNRCRPSCQDYHHFQQYAKVGRLEALQYEGEGCPGALSAFWICPFKITAYPVIILVLPYLFMSIYYLLSLGGIFQELAFEYFFSCIHEWMKYGSSSVVININHETFVCLLLFQISWEGHFEI